jgi:predicted permease
MRLLAALRFRFAALFNRSEINIDMDDELASHMEHRADDLERSGVPRAEAERRARVEFGGYVKFREQSQQAVGGDTLEVLAQDLRYSVRVLRKSPGFVLAAVLTLALAIGANAVVFGMLNAIMLRPLNVPQPKSLYSIERGPNKDANESYPDYLDLRDRSHSFDAIALYDFVSAAFDTGEGPIQRWGYEVSGNYFEALRVQPYLGRFFQATDERGPDSAPYVVLSYAYWHAQLHDDPRAVGRVIEVNKHPFTILGVAPRGFQGTLIFIFPDFWVPAVDHGLLTGNHILNSRAAQSFIMTLGHLKEGVTPAQAVADLNGVGAWLEKTYPKEDAQMTFTLARPSLAGDLLGPPARGFVSGLMLLAALILLAACANLGSLFAARAADRSREVGLRLALGSSRSRILRGVLTEAFLVSLIGGALGLMGSVALLKQLSVWHPIPEYPIAVPVQADANVYIVALGLSLLSGFLFGMAPVRQILRTHPYEVLKAGGTGVIAGGAGRRVTLRDLLLVVQIAICAVLVTSSLVAVKGLLRSMHGNFGFVPNHASIVDTNLTMAGYTDQNKLTAMQRQMVEALEAIPGVEHAGLISQIPLGGGGASDDVYSDQTAELMPANKLAESTLFRVSPDYLRAAGTRLIAGRQFTWSDNKDAPRVAIINQQFARTVFGSPQAALGKAFKAETGVRITVVGVVEDGRYVQLTEDLRPAMFWPFLQAPSGQTSLVVRSSRDPEALAGAMRARLRKLDPGLPLQISTWTDTMGLALFVSRVAAVALGVLGGVGAMLAVTGIFGLAAYSVSKRLRELGIRMALGAQRKEVLAAALRRPLQLLALGSAAGLGLGLLATRVLTSIVYQANPRDPVVLGGVVLAMALLGLVATWVPAQRALRVNPLILLREE